MGVTTARRVGPWIAGVGLALAVAATLVVLYAPLVTVVSMEVGVPGEPTPPRHQVTHMSILESGDWDVLPAAAIPLALAALPLVFVRRRFAHVALVTSAALLSVFSLLASWSIGWAYLPATISMWAAAAVEGRQAKNAQPETA